MLASERRHAILREVELHGNLTVSEFAARLNVSGMTVRRDLLELESAGLIERVHGGAVRRRTNSTGRAHGPLATIGFIVPSANYYFPAMIAGAKAAAVESGARLVLGITDYSPEVERHQISRLLSKGVDGLIVTPSDQYSQDSATYHLLAAATSPVIVMERSLADANADMELGSVRSDHAHGAKLAIRHLVAAGSTRPALVMRPGPTSEALRVGYRLTMSELLPGAPLRELELARPAMPTLEHRRVLGAVIDRCVEEQVDGLLVLPDEAAIALVDMAIDRGLAVPGDISIVAYDDEVASLAAVPVTAVAPPKADVGAVAVRACLDRIARRESSLGAIAQARIDLLPRLHIRESSYTTAPAQRDVPHAAVELATG